MGLSPFSRSTYDYQQPGTAPSTSTGGMKVPIVIPETIIIPPNIIPPNPNPSKFKILRENLIGGFLVVEIAYEGCTNYEGKKILVFKDATYQQLIEQNSIDPHFSENEKFISPIARFEPTERGWQWACNFCRSDEEYRKTLDNR